MCLYTMYPCFHLTFSLCCWELGHCHWFWFWFCSWCALLLSFPLCPAVCMDKAEERFRWGWQCLRPGLLSSLLLCTSSKWAKTWPNACFPTSAVLQGAGAVGEAGV
jgi:hypothetical protein